MDRWRTPSEGPLSLLHSSLLLFPLSLGYSELLSLVSTPWSLLILCRAFHSRVLCLVTIFNVKLLKVNLGVIGTVKKPIYSSKPAVERMLIALAIYSSFIKRLEDRGELFK